MEQLEAGKLKVTREAFFSLVKLADVGFDWLESRSSDMDTILNNGRTSDLVITSQSGENNEDSSEAHHFVTRFVIRLGRPLLIMPRGQIREVKFKHIIVAWNGSREAARAVADAMPFLQEAKFVLVLTIQQDEPQILPDFSIGDYLARHGVQCEIRQEKSQLPNTSEWLLLRAKEMHADLLVMGAFGHSRFSEWLLGGMTKKILNHMPLPVLMSH